MWFLLSADPISKGPRDPALAPALLLCSPNSPQTQELMEGEKQTESEKELSFIPLENILLYKIIRPPSHGFDSSYKLRKKKSHALAHANKQQQQHLKAVKSPVRMSFLLLKNCPSLPLRTAIEDNGGLIYLFCCCCESGHA